MRKPLPGSKHVTYEYKPHFGGEVTLYLDHPPIQVQVSPETLTVFFNSKDFAKGMMVKDKALTKSLQQAQEVCRDSFHDLMEGWINGTLDCSEDDKVEQGPKDWSPKWPAGSGRAHGTVVESANTYNFQSDWQGETFEFTIFKLQSGKLALAVFWHEGGDPRGSYERPEVWTGNVRDFMGMQWMDLDDMETVGSLNADFDNGIIWAIEKLGLLQDEENQVAGAIPDVIRDTPTLLSKAIRKDILENPGKYKEWAVDAVRSLA